MVKHPELLGGFHLGFLPAGKRILAHVVVWIAGSNSGIGGDHGQDEDHEREQPLGYGKQTISPKAHVELLAGDCTVAHWQPE